MADLCIQIHPHRSPGLDMAAVRAACAQIADEGSVVDDFAVVEGTDGHDYINLMFSTDRLDLLWTLLRQHLYSGDRIGAAMRACSMAMCEGKNGWDDYLQLFHFDPKVPCDALS